MILVPIQKESYSGLPVIIIFSLIVIFSCLFLTQNDLTVLGFKPSQSLAIENNNNINDNNTTAQQTLPSIDLSSSPTEPQSPSSESQEDSTTSGTPSAPQLRCGQVVKTNTILTGDLNCTGDGLIVGNDGTTINLNGFSISGPGSDADKVVGIMVSDGSVRITGPGTIANFQAGVLISGGSNIEVTEITFEDNQNGVFATGSNDINIQKNVMDDNELGVASHSSKGVSIKSNEINDNEKAGVILVNSEQSHIENNRITGSVSGIFLDPQSHDNNIALNRLSENEVDVNNANGLDPSVTVSTFQDNACNISNPEGLCTR